jgi:FkbM family methyltransferase
MKKTILNIFGFLGSLLPNRISHLIVKAIFRNKRLVSLNGMQYVSEIASQLNIVSISVIGKYGVFSGAPNDSAVLSSYARNGEWAAKTNGAIKDFFAGRQGTYVDIGANIGMTVVPIAAHTDVNCFAFEPDPTNFRNLETNISANCNKGNVRAFNLALFDRESVLPFEISPNNLGDHRIRLGNAGPGRVEENKRRVIEVQCARLDDLNLPIDGPLFVKIDTQGAEPFVILGGMATLAKADVVLLEWAPYCISRMGGDPATVVDFLCTNFTTAKIMDAESGHEGTEFQPIKECCGVLTQCFAKWRNDPSMYLDILAAGIANDAEHASAAIERSN